MPSCTSAAGEAPSAVFVVHSASPPGSTYPNMSVVFAHMSSCLVTMFFTGVMVPHSLSGSLLSVTHSTAISLSQGIPS